jgi:hypothetical protein
MQNTFSNRGFPVSKWQLQGKAGTVHYVPSIAEDRYEINEHGFRCDSFQMRESVIYLGGLLVFGAAVEWKESWVYKFHNMLFEEYQLANLGMPLQGPVEGSWYLRTAMASLMPVVVVNMVSSYEKGEQCFLFDDASVPYDINKLNDEMGLRGINRNSRLFYNDMAVDYIRCMVPQNVLYFEIEKKEVEHLYCDKGWDNLHPGPKSHTAIAEYLKNTYENLCHLQSTKK